MARSPRSPRKGSRSRRASPAHSGNSGNFGSSRPARGRWTAQEEAYLVQLRREANNMPYRVIAQRLNRTEIACRIKLHQIRRREGGTRPNSSPRRRPRPHRPLPQRTETPQNAEAGPSGFNSRAPSAGQSSSARSTGAAAGSSPAAAASAFGQTVTPLTQQSTQSNEEASDPLNLSNFRANQDEEAAPQQGQSSRKGFGIKDLLNPEE